MDWNSIGLVLGGLGVGSLLTFIVQYVLENIRHRKQLVFNEKKNAYLEYITAMAESQTMLEKEGSWLRTKAMARIRLFGSKEVIDIMESKVAEPKGKRDLTLPLKELFDAMRKDLKM